MTLNGALPLKSHPRVSDYREDIQWDPKHGGESGPTTQACGKAERPPRILGSAFLPCMNSLLSADHHRPNTVWDVTRVSKVPFSAEVMEKHSQGSSRTEGLG